jgi:protocatechuate 3,4-dioxygenase beta subunit
MQSSLIRCLLLLAFTAGAFAQAKDDHTASIAGRITRGDQPLAGVLVFANRSNNYGGWQATSGAAKTDEDGRYKLTNLAAGQYLIMPRALADVFTGSDTLSAGKPVLVQAGETVEAVDFVLTKGSVITGKVTDENGEPVVGAEIRLLLKADRPPSLTYYSSHFYLMNKTDDRGVYRLFGLPPGKYLLRVGSEEDGSPLRNRFGGTYHPQTYYPDATTEAEATVVEVTDASEHTGINIKLAKAEPTYNVSGRIVDATSGLPIVGARVQHTKLTGFGGGIGSSGLERTNLQGEFQLSGFGPGTYRVSLLMEDGFNYYTPPQPFEVRESDINGLKLKASPGSTLSGRVVIEETKDPALTNVRAIMLIVVSEAPDRAASQSARVTLNPDGSFRAVGLRPGKARFHLGIVAGALQNPRPFILRTEKDGQAWPGDFPVNANENAMNVRVVIGYGTGLVRGQLNVSGGQLADAVPVRVVLQAQSGARESRSVLVDSNGRFWIEGLLPGEYQIVATTARPTTAGKRRKPPVPQPLTVSGEKETHVTLTLDLTEEERQ